MSIWLDGLPNYKQSPEERRAKYTFALQHGVNSSWARVMRDWRWNKLFRRFGIPTE